MKRSTKYSLLSPTLCALLAAAACGNPSAANDDERAESLPDTADAGHETTAQRDDRGDTGALDDAAPSAEAEPNDATPSADPNPDADPSADPTPSADPDTESDDPAHSDPPNSPNTDADTGTGADTDTDETADDPNEPETPVTAEDDPELNAGEYSAAAFDFQATQPLGWHPLGKDRFNLLRLEETALVINGGAGSFVTDDGQHEHTQSALSAAVTQDTASAIWAGSGNLDDDGHAELVVINHSAGALHIAIGDNSESEALATALGFDTPNGGANAGGVKAAIADFDGDGRDEIAISTAGPSGWLRIYDDALAGFALLKESALSQDQADVDLAAGNFDADAASELAVLRLGKGTDNLSLSVLDDVGHDLVSLSNVPAGDLLPEPGMGDEDSVWLSGGIVRAGNVDADEQSELYVLLSQQDVGDEGSGGLRVMGRVFDDVASAPTVIATPQVSDMAYPTASLERPYDGVFADMDGDAVDELYLLHLESSEPDFAWKMTQWIPSGNASNFSTQANYTLLDDGYNPVSMGRMTVVDGDGLVGESLVVALKQSGSEFPVKTWRIDAQPVVVAEDTRSSFAFRIGAPTVTPGAYPSSSVPLPVGADFDNDSLQVRYSGENWLSLSSPRPIVVMAAPPIKSGISQDPSRSATAYGTQLSQGHSASSEVSTSYGTTLSFETSTLTSLFGALGGIASGSISSSLDSAFSSTNTQTTIQSVGTSFSGAYPDDCIVFQGVLYTSYAYEVTRASDPSVLGKRMTVDVPVAVKTYKWTLDFYNEMLADGDVAIGAETLGHTVGDPVSYPSAATRDQLLTGVLGWKSSQVSVGQGNGDNSVTIDLSEETSHGGTSTITNTDSWGIAIAGVGYDSSVAMSDSGAYEVSIGTTTTYQGTVGDISEPSDYKQYAYDFGLFVYEFAHPAGPRFAVVNYWTGNFGPSL